MRPEEPRETWRKTGSGRAASLGESDVGIFPPGELVKLVMDVETDVLGSLTERGQPEGPQVNAGEEILTESARSDFLGQIAIGAGDEEKVG